MRRLLLLATTALALTACGGSSPEAVTYSGWGEDISTTEAPAVDLSDYGYDVGALYEAVGVTDCEPGLSPVDISGARYLDCFDAPVDIRVYTDADAADEGAEYSVAVNGGYAYRTGNVVVHTQDEAALAEFRANF